MVSGSLVAVVAVVSVGCGDEGGPKNPAMTGGGTTTSTGSGGMGGGGGEGGGGVVGPGAACEDFCDHAAELGVCPTESTTCQAQCEAFREVAPWCSAATDAVYACGASAPASSFECENGTPSLLDEACTTERDANLECLFEGPSEGLPDMTADCETHCAAAADLPCAAPDCVQSCLASMADAAPCNGIQAALIRCYAQQPADSYECTQQTPHPGDACAAAAVLAFACQTQNMNVAPR
ncbi:hypothetical protein [Chondromyces crocatus]|nr:hypothetical protein [Chondromyces crocatus]